MARFHYFCDIFNCFILCFYTSDANFLVYFSSNTTYLSNTRTFKFYGIEITFILLSDLEGVSGFKAFLQSGIILCY